MNTSLFLTWQRSNRIHLNLLAVKSLLTFNAERLLNMSRSEPFKLPNDL